MAKSLLPAAVVIALGVKALQELILPMPVMSVARLPATLDAMFRDRGERRVGDGGVVRVWIMRWSAWRGTRSCA